MRHTSRLNVHFTKREEWENNDYHSALVGRWLAEYASIKFFSMLTFFMIHISLTLPQHSFLISLAFAKRYVHSHIWSPFFIKYFYDIQISMDYEIHKSVKLFKKRERERGGKVVRFINFDHKAFWDSRDWKRFFLFYLGKKNSYSTTPIWQWN